jgi:hypothetical protein
LVRRPDRPNFGHEERGDAEDTYGRQQGCCRRRRGGNAHLSWWKEMGAYGPVRQAEHGSEELRTRQVRERRNESPLRKIARRLLLGAALVISQTLHRPYSS